MSIAKEAGITYDKDEEVLAELEASIVDSKTKIAKPSILAAKATIVVTNKRIMSIAGSKTGCKICCCCGSSARSVRYFNPKQITEIGYSMISSKKCCCGNNNFSIYILTSGVNRADIYLNNMQESAVQEVLNLMNSVITK